MRVLRSGLVSSLARYGSGRARRVAVVGALVGAFVLGTGLAAPHQQQAARDPFILFQQLVPVIQHDRCVNCHGGVDPIGGTDHVAGPIDPTKQPCNTCHTQAVNQNQTGHWHTPQPFDFFVGKDAKALCAQFADAAMNLDSASFLHHIEHDSLIRLAFVGRSGGALDPNLPPDRPPMTDRAWVDSTKVWHAEGFAACTMDGTILQEETINSDSTHHHGHQAGQHSGEYMDTHLKQTGTRQVRITRVAPNQYRANVSLHWQGTNTIIQRTTGPSGLCTITIAGTIVHDGASTGPATVQVTTKGFPAFLRYFIDVELPPERTTQRELSSHTTTCPGPPVGDAPPSTLVHPWPKNEFTIEGELRDHNDKRLVGACDEVLVGGQPGPGTPRPCFLNLPKPKPLPFIEHVAQPSNLDGSSLPVRVHTAWNFIYR